MTKEEQLKIYAAYLPYGLLIETRTDEEIKTEGSYISKLIGIDQYGLLDEFHNTWEYEVRPILYDLSYLTKEIEHEGERFVPIEELYRADEEQHYSHCDLDDMKHFIRVLPTAQIPYCFIQKLLEWHFNVFNLPPDQFINKATLK
ncbi:hypothetical protein ACMGDK_11675 [Chryseobacterium sp. DT-3]|uniref:hypothetical protein n=1 Tax=Chryseobacterium sp. DT-3 TaxID=3396164 RepID=UPI003F1E1278